ncbi:MAG: MBL fold metallo-hydrolase [Caldilineaceae bacterium]|nr:MBL fold metallo-hydrolase [Caldilineaceae bacterium]
MHPFETLQVPQGAVGIHWFGQSSYALKDRAGTTVMVDPYFPHDRPADRFIHAEPPLDEADLRVDYVLLTHNHRDHTCIESLQRIYAANPHARFIGPEESVENMTANGIPAERTGVVSAGESAALGTMRAHAVWAKPSHGAPEDGIKAPDVTHLGYVVDVGDHRVYISGDPINTFADHDELLDPIAALKPDIGFLTTHPSEGEFPFFEGSARMATKLGLKTAVPAHYQCFVKRNYDPQEWASHLPADGPQPLIIPYNEVVIYTG